MNTNKTLEQRIEAYAKAIVENDHKKMVSFMYPPLFDFVSKEAMEKALSSAASNDTINVQISNHKLALTEPLLALFNIEYSLIKISFIQTIQYLSDTEEARGQALFMYELLKEKYGVSNVLFDPKTRQIKANSLSTLLAIREEEEWTFLQLTPNTIDLYAKFLPEPVINKLTPLFEVEEEEAKEEIIGQPDNQLKKLISVVEIDRNKNMEAIYLIGWEVLLNGDQQCQNFIATQITDQQTFEHTGFGLELIFTNKKLTLVNEYNDGVRTERILEKEEIGMPYFEFKKNKILNAIESNDGLHQLGGELPDGFQLPENNCAVPFQYLGFIDHRDPNFGWLPFKLHLTCPIYLNIFNVFLDYTDPNKPFIINREDVESADNPYGDDLNPNSEIVFNEMRFSFREDLAYYSDGHSGIPKWIQFPNIPTCPKSGKRMKFLCQSRGGDLATKRTNIVPKDESDRRHYEKLHFWGDGDLFVFFEPTSKVACYFMQST